LGTAETQRGHFWPKVLIRSISGQEMWNFLTVMLLWK
jgi:hypothetical protein